LTVPVGASRGACPALSSAGIHSLATAEGRAGDGEGVQRVDRHTLSATIEVVDDKETVIATGRVATDKAGMPRWANTSRSPQWTWAVEVGNGAGRPLAQRLLADDEHVVDVPAKLSARARALDTGHNRKSDPHAATRSRWSPSAPRHCSAGVRR
jgi:hypothetical protein